MPDKNPNQVKASIWKGKGTNAATPMFDPGLSPLGTDDEAGGASVHKVGQAVTDAPNRTTPEAGGIGVRLTPRVWLVAGAVLVVVLIVAAIASF